MRKENTYIDVLLETLVNKNNLLDKLIHFTKEQAKLLSAQDFNQAEFDVILEEKETLLQKLKQFDAGFGLLYQRVKEELKENKALHKEAIIQMQILIQQITDKGLQIKNDENKNRIMFEQYVRRQKEKIREFKMNNKAAANYYKNMANLQMNESYFLDKKK